MNDLIFQLHTPEEFRYLSSLGHWIVGYIFFGVALIVLLQTLGFLSSKKYLWPILVVAAGIILIPFNLLHHSLAQLPLVWKVIELDPQQRQHLIMFNLIFVAGLIELFLSLKRIKNKTWQFVWPGVLFIIGLMFLFHPQHGTTEALAYSVPYHKTLGTVLVLTGLFKTAEVVWSKRLKWLVWFWIIFLFITSGLLIIYNEPEGAYTTGSLQNQMMNRH